MAKFEGNNKMTASEIFKNRLLYSVLAFSKDGETTNIVPEATRNFWLVENMFYGRIREESGEISIIVPKSENLIDCKKTSGRGSARALDFVVDAHQNLVLEYEKNRLISTVVDGSAHLTELLVHRGAADLSKKHKKSLAGMNKRFVSYGRHKDIKTYADKIFSFDDFVPFFMEFLLKSVKSSPATISSYLISKRSTPMSSGLCLEFSSSDHSDDAQKSDLFLDDENFQIYRILAANSGFAVDKNAPWRLVADIRSKKMLEFAANRVPGIATAEDILDHYFEDIRDNIDELEDFKAMIYASYNNFFLENPVVYERGVDSERKIIKNTNKRTRERFDTIDARFENDFWYDKYIRVKNEELSLGYSETEVKKLIKNAVDLEISFDRSKATGYIKKRMTPIISSEGSLVYRMLKLNDVNIKESPKEDAQALARSLNKKIY